MEVAGIDGKIRNRIVVVVAHPLFPHDKHEKFCFSCLADP